MKRDDCCGLPELERCDCELPDSPQCAPNYHFGMLLGVADFRAEQGFHVGRLRRHQRLLHGAGVVAGYAVTYRPADQELRVGSGYAIDVLGRDLVLEVPQCVNLPLWWLAHREDDAFEDIETPDDATLDLDVVVCYSCCLDTPVPAIADPCAGNASDIAYSRLCETVQLRLVRTAPQAAPLSQPFHLLQMWLGLAAPRPQGTADGAPLREADQWLVESFRALQALPAQQQAQQRPALVRELLARAVAEQAPEAPTDEPGETDLCLPLARLRGLRLKLEPDGWKVTLAGIDLGVRDSLLPTSLLQGLLLGEPAPQPALAGPVVAHDGAALAGKKVTLVFSQPLATMSVASGAFAASEFVTAQGWKPFTLAPPAYDDSVPGRPQVTLTLDRDPVGALVRITVTGTGNTPLLGSTFIPAGAVTPTGEGRNLSTTIPRV